jgi:hypothetical protein
MTRPPEENRLYLALPSYDGLRINAYAILQPILQAAKGRSPFRGVLVDDVGYSALAHNFNGMWARALNARAKGITHFVMLHSDVMPQSPTWAEDMYRIMERERASVLSVVLPLKDQRGLTSTAIDTGDIWAPRRLALTEIFLHPPTFAHERLLVNTGLMMVDFRAPWVEKVHFTLNDEIRQNPSGEFYAAIEPEDWFFSRRARELGARLVATREIAASHYGSAEFLNTTPWGDLDTEPGHDQALGLGLRSPVHSRP